MITDSFGQKGTFTKRTARREHVPCRHTERFLSSADRRFIRLAR